MAQILEQAAALGEDAGEADLPPPSGPAPHRFAAAVKASVEAAAAAGTTKAAEARRALAVHLALPVDCMCGKSAVELVIKHDCLFDGCCWLLLVLLT